MKHWDERERSDAMPARLSRAERQRLRAMFAQVPAHRRRQPLDVGSVIGVVLAVGLLVGLAILLTPADPVSSKLLR